MGEGYLLLVRWALHRCLPGATIGSTREELTRSGLGARMPWSVVEQGVVDIEQEHYIAYR